jgi:predicted DNA-binding ribbon-helix-helix protein
VSADAAGQFDHVRKDRDEVARRTSLSPHMHDERVTSPVIKRSVARRSVAIAGNNTNVTLEDAFWTALKEIAASREMTLSNLVAAINSERRHSNLSSAIRLFVLGFYRDQIFEHQKRD